MRKLLVFGIIIAVAVLMFSGCSKRTVVTPDGRATVTANDNGGGTVEVETDEGKATVTTGEDVKITEAELGVPMYPGATAQASGKFEGQGDKGGQSFEQYTLMTGDSVDKVKAFYKSNLKNVQNTIEQDTPDGKVTMFMLESGGKVITVNISSNTQDKKTMIMVSKAPK